MSFLAFQTNRLGFRIGFRMTVSPNRISLHWYATLKRVVNITRIFQLKVLTHHSMWVTKISVLILLPYIETHLKRNDTFVRVCSCLLDLTVTFLVINLSSISSSLGCPTTSLKSSTSRVINQNFGKFSKINLKFSNLELCLNLAK